MATNQTTFGNVAPKTNEPGITVSNETAGKIGLLGAMSVIIGAIIGIGIFFKNKSVFNSNNGNPWGILVSWIVVLIIALCTAYSYGEITRAKTRSAESGLAGWSERYVGYRFSRFVKLNYPLFYYGIYFLAMSIFLSEAIFNIAMLGNGGKIDGINLWFMVLMSFCIIIFFVFINWLSTTFTTKVATPLSFCKFAPILFVIIGGFVIAGVSGNKTNLFVDPGNIYGHHEDGYFTFTGMLNSLPAILFAFDSFLIVGNVAKNVKNPNKTIPLSIVISMTTAGIIYVFITLAQICCGCGDPYSLAKLIFHWNDASNNVSAGQVAVVTIVSAFLMISVLGVVNSVTLAAIRSAQSAIEEEVVFGAKWFKKISNGKKSPIFGGCILTLILQAFWFTLASIPSGILQTDQIYDGFSNLVVVFFYLIYGFVPLMMIAKNKVPTSEVQPQKLRKTTAIIAFIGCTFIAGYSIVWTYFLDPIINPKTEFEVWGLFFDNATKLSKPVAAGIFWGVAALFFAFPFINDALIKLTDKNYKQPLLWEKATNEVKIENANQ